MKTNTLLLITLSASLLLAQFPTDNTAADSMTVAPVVAQDTMIRDSSHLSKKSTLYDDVMFLTDNEIRPLLNKVSQGINKSRVLGYGGCGGFTPALLMMDLAPVRKLIAGDPKLKGQS